MVAQDVSRHGEGPCEARAGSSSRDSPTTDQDAGVTPQLGPLERKNCVDTRTQITPQCPLCHYLIMTDYSPHTKLWRLPVIAAVPIRPGCCLERRFYYVHTEAGLTPFNFSLHNCPMRSSFSTFCGISRASRILGPQLRHANTRLVTSQVKERRLELQFSLMS